MVRGRHSVHRALRCACWSDDPNHQCQPPARRARPVARGEHVGPSRDRLGRRRAPGRRRGARGAASCRTPAARPGPRATTARRRRRPARRRARPGRRPWRGDGDAAGASTPSASRRVVSRKPVCPIIRCCGRTASPSRCQPRTIDSHASRLGVPAVGADVLGQPRQLRGRRDVGDEHAAGRERVGDGVEVLPRREHVEHHAVDAAGLGHGRQHVGQVADRQLPRGVRAAEEALDVAAGDRREVLAPLDGVQRAAVADRAQQRHGQRAGADAGLDRRARPGRCRPSRRSGRRPWGRPRRRRAASTARSRRAAGAARGTRCRRCCATTEPSGAPMQLVVAEVAAVRVERGALGERDRVQPPARVGELDAVARTEGPRRCAAPVDVGASGCHGARV